MFGNRFTSNLCLGALLSTALLTSCGSSEPPMSLGPMPNSAEEQALKALKDKFYIDKNCEVYQKIVTFSCDSGIVQVMCKDTAGMAQIGYFKKDMTPTGWYSEKDIDDQIAAAEMQLMALKMRKGDFAPAHNPGYQCSPL